MEFLEGNMKDFVDKSEQDRRMLNEEMQERSIAKCSKCGSIYSYGYETGYENPGKCASCRGALGELIY
jgi:hypothetical protein